MNLKGMHKITKALEDDILPGDPQVWIAPNIFDSTTDKRYLTINVVPLVDLSYLLNTLNEAGLMHHHDDPLPDRGPKLRYLGSMLLPHPGISFGFEDMASKS
jgi:hypothetical protein